MAKAKDFSGAGFNQDLVLNDYSNLAAAEIYSTYGHRVKINRKTLHKYGRALDVDQTEVHINLLSRDEVFPTGNDIDIISSTNASDTQEIRIEGMVLNGSDALFTVQTAILNGQNKVALDIPLFRCTRMENVSTSPTSGDVYIYRDGTISGGIPNDLDLVHNLFSSTEQATLKAATTIAATNYFLINKVHGFVNRSSGTVEVDFRFREGPLNGVLATKEIYSSTNISPQCEIDFSPFRIIPPNTDVVMTAEGDANNSTVNAGFYGIFADIIE